MDFQGNRLDWQIDVAEALRRWPLDQRVMLLHSGRPHARWSRWSILTSPIGTYRFHEADNSTRGISSWTGCKNTRNNIPSFQNHPWHDVRSLINSYPKGLWVGTFSYDIARWIEQLPKQAKCDRDWPIIELTYCPGVLAHDNLSGQWYACGDWAFGNEPTLEKQVSHSPDFHIGEPTSMVTQAQHEEVVQKGIDYIAAGDVFQVNLAQRFTAPFHTNQPTASRVLYEKLAQVSPAWYGAYIELASENTECDVHNAAHTATKSNLFDRAIASTSPELFLDVNAKGHVVTRPIKGTRPASTDPAELANSPKDTAELNMIVDLLRNDLGRVCQYGSVKVSEPRKIESHPTVHHGVATIEGQLHPSKDIIDLLKATLPGGSVSGAPKVRAMEIIDELEPVRRGPYCGVIGYLTAKTCCFNVAIRTMLIEPAHNRIDFSVGGGIVADSDPSDEYEETLDKAQAMLQALRVKEVSR